MKGFVGVLFLLLVFVLFSVVLYFLLIGYQRYKGAEYATNSLTEVESSFTYFDTYTPSAPTVLKPSIKLHPNGTLSYKSSFSPCMTLVEDRTWEIYSRQNNILPTYISKMFYDRFWRIGWLGLKPRGSENEEFAFYGPFRYADQPKRNYIEYVLIGKDVVMEEGKLEVAPTKDDCSEKQLTRVDSNL